MYVTKLIKERTYELLKALKNTTPPSDSDDKRTRSDEVYNFDKIREIYPQSSKLIIAYLNEYFQTDYNILIPLDYAINHYLQNYDGINPKLVDIKYAQSESKSDYSSGLHRSALIIIKDVDSDGYICPVCESKVHLGDSYVALNDILYAHSSCIKKQQESN